MASPHSYKITLSNNKTENQALSYLLSLKKGFVRPDSAGKKAILRLLQLPEKFSRTFDLVLVNKAAIGKDILTLTKPNQVKLIEVKSTQKRLPNHPGNFFFGATHNEFKLALRAGDRLQFCFVCLHPETQKHVLMTLSELNQRIRTKRIQYQINFKP